LQADVFDGGVPVRILFDNMSSAVVHIEAHGERKLTETFMRFAMHHRFMADLQREHYVKKESISDLFKAEQEQLIPLPREPFRVFNLEKVKTDKYSFIHFDCNRYSTSPKYAECEMWLEISTSELCVLNKNYEQVAVHERRHGKEVVPIIRDDKIGDAAAVLELVEIKAR
jgi:hypothetical protein